MKIDIAVSITSEGRQDPICDSQKNSEWSKRCFDVRPLMKLVQGSFLCIYFEENACILIYVAPAEMGRGGDNTAVYFYIPKTAKISGQDILDVRKKIVELLNKKEKIEYSVLSNIVSKEYDERKYPLPYKVNTLDPEKNAFRVVSDDSKLIEVFDQLHQDYYANYKYIFLVDKKIENSSMDDLTDDPLVKTCVLIPPTKENIEKSLGSGVTLSLDGHPFTEHQRSYEGAKLPLVAQREGFEAKRLGDIEAKEEEQQITIPDNEESEWFKVIDKSKFKVYDDYLKRDIDESRVHIRINGQELGKDGLKQSEKEWEKCKLSIEVDEYDNIPVPENSQLLSNGFIPIKMSKKNKKQKSQEFTLSDNVKNVEKITVKVDYKYSLDEPFMKGYKKIQGGKLKWDDTFQECSAPVNHQDSENNNARQDKNKIKIFTALLGVLLIVSVAFNVYWVIPDDSETVSAKKDSAPADTTNTQVRSTDTDKQSAINYLDGNKNWKDTTMEKYPDLKDLFDALNQYNYDQVISVLKPFEWKSKKIKNLLECINKAKASGAELKGPYTKSGNINIEEYIKNINNHEEEAPANSFDEPKSSPTPAKSSSKSGGKSSAPAKKSGSGAKTSSDAKNKDGNNNLGK